MQNNSIILCYDPNFAKLLFDNIIIVKISMIDPDTSFNNIRYIM